MFVCVREYVRRLKISHAAGSSYGDSIQISNRWEVLCLKGVPERKADFDSLGLLLEHFIKEISKTRFCSYGF